MTNINTQWRCDMTALHMEFARWLILEAPEVLSVADVVQRFKLLEFVAFSWVQSAHSVGLLKIGHADQGETRYTPNCPRFSTPPISYLPQPAPPREPVVRKPSIVRSKFPKYVPGA